MRIRTDTPKVEEEIVKVRRQTKFLKNDVNFLMCGIVNVEEVKKEYNGKVGSYDGDVKFLT